MSIFPKVTLLTSAIAVISLSAFLLQCYCYTIEDVERFLNDKLSGYDNRIRPIHNQTKPVVVELTFYLVTVQEFDEVLERVSFSGYFIACWTDEKLSWNPANYAGIEFITLRSDSVWKPNIILGNSAEKAIKLHDDWMQILYRHNGSANFYFGDALTVSCKVDITYYPWDRQTCQLYVITMPSVPSHVILTSSINKVLTDTFFENGAWEFVGSSVEQYREGTALIYNIVLHRKPTFFIVNIILPIIFMSFLNSVVFLIPADSGERISYSITVFLSIAVFLSLVSDNLPKSSNPMSLFSYYILVVLIISICIILATTFSLRLFYLNEYVRKPSCMVLLVNCVLSKHKRRFDQEMFSKRLKDYQVNAQSQSSQGKNEHYHKHGKLNRPISKPVLPERQNIWLNNRQSNLNADDKRVQKQNHIEDKNKEYSNVSWKDVSYVIDKIFFIFFNLMTTLATAIFFSLLISN